MKQIFEDAPPYRYVLYVDEAGDPGLRAVKPLSTPGASEWLILSGVLVRAENEQLVGDWVADLTSGIKNHQANGLHFTNLNPANKLSVCKKMANLQARYFVVASNKKNMQGYENPQAAQIPSDNWFYCWMTRLLLERVTHFVDARKPEKPSNEGNFIRVEYSARGGLRYSQMNAYYEWMRQKNGPPFLPWGSIKWDTLHPNLMKVYPHKDRLGLQLADVVASSFFKACDKYDTGACDTRYAKELQPRMAREPDRPSGDIAGYGVKLLPSMEKAKLDSDQAEIFKFYGYPRQWWDPDTFSVRR